LLACATIQVVVLDVDTDSRARRFGRGTKGIAVAVSADFIVATWLVTGSTMFGVVVEVGAGRSARGQGAGAFE